jgi:hypothetical protein|tara:strand:+ start:313 stop:729 length:417 start_codon:yes stop_codon:yes gene_type:complete
MSWCAQGIIDEKLLDHGLRGFAIAGWEGERRNREAADIGTILDWYAHDEEAILVVSFFQPHAFAGNKGLQRRSFRRNVSAFVVMSRLDQLKDVAKRCRSHDNVLHAEKRKTTRKRGLVEDLPDWLPRVILAALSHESK